MKKIISLLFIIALCYSPVSGQNCTNRITGHVHTTSTHENLSNAVVTLQETGKTIITDFKGDFVFDSLCSGTYHIKISHTSFTAAERTVILSRNSHLDIDLVPSTNVLEEVTVTGNRPQPITGTRRELSGRELDEARGYSLGEALGRISGVSQIQTGSTISKPVIHGLHSNRILTINNGVRQEGQQWGNEHAPEIDPFIANRLTIIKGVDELRYGSDAIGGVILIEPRGLRLTPGYSSEVNTIYFTNNRQYVASAIFEQQLKRWPSFTYRLQGSFKRGANIRTPNYRLNNTGLEEKNFSATAGWRREHFTTELYYSLFNTDIGIFTGSHIGNLTDLRNAIATDRPDPTFIGENTYRIQRPRQDVMHHLLKSRTSFDIKQQKINVLIAGQLNQRKEYDIVRSATTTAPQINLSIVTLTEEINWERPKKSNLTGTLSVMAIQQDNSYSGRYLIPNYRSYTFGGYGLEKWASGKWDLQAGLRYDYKTINTSRLQTASQTFTNYQFNFSTLASTFTAGYRLLPEWKLGSVISFASRAPHVNELLTNGIHHGSGTYEVGDINLKPEKSFNMSLNSNYTSENKVFSADITFYRNNIRDYIFQQPKPDEPVLTIRGAFPKIVYQSTDALLKGMDLSTNVHIIDQLSLSTRYNLLRAKNKRINDWLIGMPADRISNELTYNFKDLKHFTGSYISVEMQNVFEQTRVPDEKNGKQDYKAPPEGYSLINADISSTMMVSKVPVTLSIGVRNLLNQTYREYLNTFRYFTDEMGRNISLRLKIGLQHFY